MKNSQNKAPLVRLSERLSAIAEMVDGREKYGRNVLCDVGTDHAHIPIRLLQEERIDAAIAMDVIPGPLEKARENLNLYDIDPGLVELRLSDGLNAYQIGEAQTLVIAGMGGRIMSRILLREPEKTCDFAEMVLQPQSDPDYVRRALRQLGLFVDREKMVLEDGKYYPVIHAVPDGGKNRSDQTIVRRSEKSVESEWQQEEDLFGPVLLREKDSTLHRYLLWQKGVCERILCSMDTSGNKGSGEFRHRKKTVIRQLHLIDMALREWEEPE